MMEQLSSGQNRLFYSFNLEDHIHTNHLLRSIDRCLDPSDLRHHLADFYSPIGRPSIDPELRIRMSIVGYCYAETLPKRLSLTDQAERNQQRENYTLLQGCFLRTAVLLLQSCRNQR